MDHGLHHATGCASLLLLALLSPGCAGSAPEPEPESDLPNVLLITLDTTRADHLTPYGYERPTSPRLAAIAADGTLFERALAQASVTPVSHASIFTGLLPNRHGLRFLHGNYGYELPDEATTLAEILAERGYTTAAFVSAFPAGSRFGLNQGFAGFDEDFRSDDGHQLVSDEGVVNTGTNQRTAEATNRVVFDWLNSKPRGPLFVWVHYFDPHDTHLFSEEPGDAERFPPVDDSPASLYRAKYDVEIASMDRHMGELVDRFSALQAPLLTAIVGDHGQGLGDHDWWSHGLLYEEQIRVPFVLHGPGVPAGQRVEELVRTIDLLPTMLELLEIDDVQPAMPFQGVDLLARLGQSETPGPLLGYAESTSLLTYSTPLPDEESDVKNDQLFTIVVQQWKYIHHRFGLEPDELYDVVADPGETTNLIAQQPALANKMKAKLLSFGVYPEKSENLGGMSQEDVERLRSLGYVQ